MTSPIEGCSTSPVASGPYSRRHSLPVPGTGRRTKNSGADARRRDARVFVKLAHGSSASGVVEIRGGQRDRACTTSVELAPRAGGIRALQLAPGARYGDANTSWQCSSTPARRAGCTSNGPCPRWCPVGKTFDFRLVTVGGRGRMRSAGPAGSADHELASRRQAPGTRRVVGSTASGGGRPRSSTSPSTPPPASRPRTTSASTLL